MERVIEGIGQGELKLFRISCAGLLFSLLINQGFNLSWIMEMQNFIQVQMALKNAGNFVPMLIIGAEPVVSA